MSKIWNEAMTKRGKEISEQMIALKPYEDSPEGLNRMKNLVISLFSEKGFEIEEIKKLIEEVDEKTNEKRKNKETGKQEEVEVTKKVKKKRHKKASAKEINCKYKCCNCGIA